MSTIASQITSLAIVYSTVYSGADQRRHQSSASLAFVWGIHRGPVNSPHKWPVTRKMFPFDDVIMRWNYHAVTSWEINTTIILICFLCVCVYCGVKQSSRAARIISMGHLWFHYLLTDNHGNFASTSRVYYRWLGAQRTLKSWCGYFLKINSTCSFLCYDALNWWII